MLLPRSLPICHGTQLCLLTYSLTIINLEVLVAPAMPDMLLMMTTYVNNPCLIAPQSS